MKLGVFLAVYHDRPFEDALDRAVDLGLDAVEIATGNYPGDAHCRAIHIVDDRSAVDAMRAAVERRGLVISALSQHGNPLHPDRTIATAHHDVWRATVRLAEQLGVRVVNAFSGCPGDHDHARRPNWVTCSWPPDFPETLAWQWEREVVPYWTREAAFAADHGVIVGIEMHPGNVVYNPSTLVRLRDACGPAIAANFDPSHLFWQGIDPLAAVRRLAAEASVVHVDVKDTALDDAVIARDGVLETRPASDPGERAYRFRTIGDGHGAGMWRDLLKALNDAGYDGALSIEHEDRSLPADAGVERAVRFLRDLA